MSKRILATLFVAVSLSACDSVTDGVTDETATAAVDIVDGRLVFSNSTAFGDFIADAKEKDQPVIALLNWGDEIGFRSYVHAEALANGAEEDVAARKADAPAVIGGHDPFFKSLLSPEGELQVGDQLLRVDSTHSTLYAADGSVLRRAPIEEQVSNARIANSGSSVYPQKVDDFFGPIDETDRQLRRYRFTGAIDTDEYLLYWTVQGISEHDRLKKNWLRGWYYGDDDANTVRVTCTTTYYDMLSGGRPTVAFTRTETDQATNNDYVDVQIDYTVNVTSRPQLDSECTHYVNNKGGYTRTVMTSYSR